MERAEAFYRDVLGMTVCARREKPDMTFFTMGNHHDFAIAALGADAPRPGRKSVGLAHVAFKIGDDIEVLREAKAHLDAAGVRTHPVDHEVTLSLYFETRTATGSSSTSTLPTRGGTSPRESPRASRSSCSRRRPEFHASRGSAHAA